MKHSIDIDRWDRKEQFKFFSDFDEPFFGITAEVDCSKAYQHAKSNDISFFLLYLHASLKAANSIDAFKFRIEGEEVFCYDIIHASPTINRDNGTFGFSYMDFYPDFAEFATHAQQEIDRVKKSNTLIPAVSGENVIHYSSIPWIRFTALSHARHFGFQDSCPKISFGKLTSEKNQLLMPVSVHAHHALVDGFHVGQFLEKFQHELNQFE